MDSYLSLLSRIRALGTKKEDRTGTGTISVFGHQSRYDLRARRLPVVTTKKIHLKSVIHELLWFIKGDSNVRYLQENGVRIWDEWADGNGDLGPVYGKQWRSWDTFHPNQAPGTGWWKKSIDQLADAIHQLRTNPDSRRIIVSAWNPADVPQMKLPPCHLLFQFYSRPLDPAEIWDVVEREHPQKFVALGGYAGNVGGITQFAKDNGLPLRALSCQLYQRSADAFLGVPFNITSYALLTHMVAHVTGHVAESFVHTLGDAHIYLNHLEQVDEQLRRAPWPAPRVILSPSVKEIDDFGFDDIQVENYKHHAHIAGKVAV